MAFELTGNPLNDISAPIEELSESFNSTLVFDFGNGVGITQYTFWMIIICAIVIVGVLVGVRKIKVVPEGKFAGLVEWGYDAVRRNMGEGCYRPWLQEAHPVHRDHVLLHPHLQRDRPYPGREDADRTLSGHVRTCIALFPVLQLLRHKAKGGWGYIKSIAPSAFLSRWFRSSGSSEFFSLVIRPADPCRSTLRQHVRRPHDPWHLRDHDPVLHPRFDLVRQSRRRRRDCIGPCFLVAMYALECLVAFLQAYVFSVLTAVYVGLAQSEH